MRAFIAIEIPEGLNEYIECLQKKFEGLGKINFTKKPYHLTLKFLGEISEDQFVEIDSLLKTIKMKPFELEFTKLGVFPNENYIKVLWLGVKGRVNELQQKIDSILKEMFCKDKRFHPHITIGRVKFVNDKKKIKELLGLDVKKLRFEVKEFRLIKSELTPDGPVYTDLKIY